MTIPRSLLQLFRVKQPSRTTWWRCPYCNLLADMNSTVKRDHRCR